jgi:hypothetical protein
MGGRRSPGLVASDSVPADSGGDMGMGFTVLFVALFWNHLRLGTWAIPLHPAIGEYRSEPGLSTPVGAVHSNARHGARTKRDATRPSIKSQSKKETDIISLTGQEVRYVRGDVSLGCPSRSWRLAGQLGNKLRVFEY